MSNLVSAAPGWESTRVQCVECGSTHTSVHPAGADLFNMECPYCGSHDSLPIGYEASLLEDPDDVDEINEAALGHVPPEAWYEG